MLERVLQLYSFSKETGGRTSVAQRSRAQAPIGSDRVADLHVLVAEPADVEDAADAVAEAGALEEAAVLAHLRVHLPHQLHVACAKARLPAAQGRQ